MGIMNQMTRMFSKPSTSAPETEAPHAETSKTPTTIEPAVVVEAPQAAAPAPAPVAEPAPVAAPLATPNAAAVAAANDKLDMELAATFDTLEHGNTPLPATTSAVPLKNDDLTARLAEAEARLSLITESHAVAVKERDAADEGRRKLEKTLSEFLARFASVRETQSTALKEVEKLVETRSHLEKQNAELLSKLASADEVRQTATRALEQKISDLTGQLGATEEAWAKAKRERDELQVRVDRQHQEVLDSKAELTKFREMAVASLEPLGVDFNKMMKLLVCEAEGLMAQMQQARDEATQRQEALTKLTESLKTHINTSRKDLSQKLSMVTGSPAGESGTRPAITAVPPPSPAPSAGGTSSAA